MNLEQFKSAISDLFKFKLITENDSKIVYEVIPESTGWNYENRIRRDILIILILMIITRAETEIFNETLLRKF